MNTKILALTLLTLAGCASKNETTIDNETYRREIDDWHANREEVALKGPNGWLNLVGLFWLKDGFNTFGSGQGNDLVFPEGKIAENAGTFVVQQGQVTLKMLEGMVVNVNDSTVNEITAYAPGMTGPVVVNHGALEWFVIERNGVFGVRLRDLESEAVKNFHGVDRYPVDLKWRVEAEFKNSEEGKTIDITNILGQTYPQSSPGTLVFTIDEVEMQLDVLDDGDEDEYFVIFADPTNEKETYPSGRYMYVKKPGPDNLVMVDFNKSYNPPCAFTEYATCPLPPKQNRLPVAIMAGEKNFGDH